MSENIATIGVAFDGTDLERGKASLEAIAAAGPKVEASLKGVETTAARTGKTIGNLGGSSKIADLGKDGATAAAGVEKLGQAAKGSAAAMDSIAKSGAGEFLSGSVALGAKAAAIALLSTSDEAERLRSMLNFSSGGGMTSALQALGGQAGGILPVLASALSEVAEQQQAIANGAGAAAGGLSDVAGGANDAADAARNAGEALNAARTSGVAFSGTFALVATGALAVAAAGAVVFAAYQAGRREAEEYNKTLILTGNAAGVSADRLSDMARSIDSASFGITQSKAAEVLNAMAQGGDIAAESLQRYVKTAIEFERTGAGSAEAVGKAFSDLAADPLAASEKLNKSTNFLTAELYNQIKALEEQGNSADAASVAQEAYANMMNRRIPELEENLGLLARAWRGVKDAAREAWSGMMDVGRAQTMGDKLANAEKLLSDYEATLPGKRTTEQTSRVQRAGGVDGLRNQIAGWRELIDTQKKSDEQQKANNESTAAAIELSKGATRFDSQLEKQRKAVALATETYTNALAAGNLSASARAQAEKDYLKTVAGITAVTKKRTAATSAGQSEVASIRARVIETQRYIDAMQTQGLEGAKLNEGEKLSLKIREELTGKLSAVARANKQIALVEAERLASLQKTAAAEEKQLKIAEANEKAYGAQIESMVKAAEGTDKQAQAQESANATFGQGKAAIEAMTLAQQQSKLATLQSLGLAGDYTEALELQIEAQKRYVKAMQEGEYKTQSKRTDELMRSANEEAKLYQEEARLTGLSALERAKVVAQRQIELKYAKELDLLNQTGLTSDAKDAERAKLQAAQQVEIAASANKLMQEDWDATVKQYDDIFRQGFADMVNGGQGAWKSFTKSLTTTFKTTVADQIYKMFLRPFVVNVVGNLLGVSGAGGAVQALAGGGGGGLMGMASNAYSAYGLYNGGIGGTAIGQAYAGYTGATLPAGMMGPSATPISMWSQAGNYAGSIGSGSAGVGAGGTAAGGSMAGFMGYAAVVALIANAMGAFRSDKAVGGGLTGTLGKGDISGYELWREGGTLFDGPNFSTKNPSDLIERYESQLEALRESGEGNSQPAFKLQTEITQLQKEYGEQIAATRKQSTSLQLAYDGMRKNVGEMADSLGVSSEKVREWTMAFGTDAVHPDLGGKAVIFDGLKDEEIAVKIQEALASANNTLAEMVLGEWVTTTEVIKRTLESTAPIYGDMEIPGEWDEITESITKTTYVASKYAKDGEKAIDTLTRLAGRLSGVNAVFKSLGVTLYEASLAGGDLASKLVDKLGGDEAFTQIASSYYEAFYTESERMASAYDLLSAELAKSGVVIPATKDAYRELVTQQLEAEESGQELAAKLLGMSGAFFQVADYAEKAAEAAAELAATLRDGLIGLESSFEGGGFSRQYKAQDTATQLQGLLSGAGIDKDAGQLAQTLLSATAAEVEGYFREIWDVLDTDEARQKLVDVGSAMMDLAKGADGMAEAYKAQQAELQKLAQDVSRLFSARNSAGSLMDKLSGAMGGKGTFGAQRESELWGALGNTRDATKQVELAGQLTDMVIARQQLEVQNAERMLEFGRGLRGYVDGLKLGSLSPLTNAEKLAEASQQYKEMLGKAQGGDASAQNGLQGIASTYLELARTYFAGNEQFGAIFGSVTSSLDALGVSSMSEAQQQLSLGTQSLGELQKLYGITETAYESLNAQYETALGELSAAQDALVLQSDSLEQLKGIAALLSSLPAEISARLPTINTDMPTYSAPLMYGGSAPQPASDPALLAEIKALREAVDQLRAENRQDAQMQAGATVASANASASQIADATAKAAHTNTVKQGAVLV